MRTRPYWIVLCQTIDAMLNDKPLVEAEADRLRAVLLEKKLIKA